MVAHQHSEFVQLSCKTPGTKHEIMAEHNTPAPSDPNISSDDARAAAVAARRVSADHDGGGSPGSSPIPSPAAIGSSSSHSAPSAVGTGARQSAGASGAAATTGAAGIGGKSGIGGGPPAPAGGAAGSASISTDSSGAGGCVSSGARGGGAVRVISPSTPGPGRNQHTVSQGVVRELAC